jgi:hypothetical protein
VSEEVLIVEKKEEEPEKKDEGKGEEGEGEKLDDKEEN